MVARNAEISRPTTRTGHVSNDTGWWTQELHQRHLSRPILPGPSVDLKGLKAVPEGPPALPGFTATTRWSTPVPHNRYSIPHGDRRSRRSLSTPTRPQQSAAAAAVTSRATGSHVPCKSPSRAHATSMPDTTWPIPQDPAKLIPGSSTHPGFDAISPDPTPSTVVHSRSSSRLPLTRSRRALSATLTTPALNRRSLRWFEASPCKATPEGHTSISHTVTHSWCLTIFYIALPLVLVAHVNPG